MPPRNCRNWDDRRVIHDIAVAFETPQEGRMLDLANEKVAILLFGITMAP